MQRVIATPKNLGIALRDRRKQRGLTQTELGALAGISQVAISNIERGVSDANIGTITRLCSALELDLILQARQSTDPASVWEEHG